MKDAKDIIWQINSPISFFLLLILIIRKDWFHIHISDIYDIIHDIYLSLFKDQTGKYYTLECDNRCQTDVFS